MSNWMLKLGGVGSAAAALFHFFFFLMPPAAVHWLGAPDWVYSLPRWVVVIISMGIGLLLSLFAVYAFSGAGCLRRLPLLRTGLLAIGAIYFLRGLLLFPQLAAWPRVPPAARMLMMVFITYSTIALLLGILHLAGVAKLIRGTE